MSNGPAGAEEVPRRSEAYFRSLIENALDIITVLEADGRIRYESPAVERVLGYQPDEMVGRNVFEFVHPDDAPKTVRELTEGLASGAQSASVVVRLRHRDGSWVTFECVGRNLVSDPAVGGVVVNSRDITERRRLVREILRISDFERRSIGRDLHDELGQRLVGIAFLAKALEQELAAASSPAAAQADQIARELNRTVEVARSLARGLCPVDLRAGGLPSGLEQIAAWAREHHEVSCKVQCSERAKLPDAAASAHLYRIAQEAVTNALKHGQPKHIAISLTARRGRGTLAVWDDGAGLPDPPASSAGLGLHIMQYRAEMIGASLDVGPAPEGGVTVTCSFPLGNEQRDGAAAAPT